MRRSGVLMAVSSLPGKYGIGCFSKEAYKFVDDLKAAGRGLQSGKAAQTEEND